MQIYKFDNNQLVHLTSDQLTCMVEDRDPQLYETIDRFCNITIKGDIIEGPFDELIAFARTLLVAKACTVRDKLIAAYQTDSFVMKEVFGDYIITEVNVL